MRRAMCWNTWSYKDGILGLWISLIAQTNMKRRTPKARECEFCLARFLRKIPKELTLSRLAPNILTK